MKNDALDNAIWVSWQRHRRTETLTSKMGIPFYAFSSGSSRFIKHPFFILRTLWLLMRKRPRILFVQNPSALLTLFAICLKPFLGYRLVVDAHNSGVYPCEKSLEKFKWAFPLFHRYADLTIVTNEDLIQIVRQHGGRAVILADSLPAFQAVDGKLSQDAPFIVTCICTYSADEPYREVIEAAALLSENVKMFVTGNTENITKKEKLEFSSSVTLTGFLSDEKFIRQLARSNCIIDLTTRDSCLVCGAYEATALEVPIILSDTPALRSYFHSGVVYTENQASDIAQAILQVKTNYARLKKEIMMLKKELLQNWERQYSHFLSVLSDEFVE